MDERGFGGGMHHLNAVFLGQTSRHCRGSGERGGAEHDVIMVPMTRFRRTKGYKKKNLAQIQGS